ncbi:ankyrin repeat and LEM domain-containing protein 1-like isoform X2 [Topomyia yanbarensis]|uniref:ankyrin repeat and LEM domain-containing protein 1-like isoform X2 n=1 Tax=Topomyia yanbarensis TaxID=2498891 RepID=UPI00273BFF00|nr:ankyrin repeat and LEM domain-containing protein 1-like isoform X2 [Topomyia yanbarensis]
MSRAEYYLALCLLDTLEDHNLESLRILLEKHNANPNAIVLEKNVAPIHLVIGVENVRLAEHMTSLMLQYGADPNLRTSEEGITPLHVAASLGRVRLVELLLKAGGDMDLQDDESKTPVEYAVEEGHFDVIRVMQNYAFERKFEKKREQMLEQNSNTGSGYIKCLGGYLRVTTPTKNCLKAVQTLDENKLTPNRVHYNFDATSPYYINITHRRRSRSKKIKDNINKSIVAIEQAAIEVGDDHSAQESTDDEDVVVGRKNLFELTERNLTDFSRNMTGMGRRSSFIECWRDKIATLRDRNKLSTNLEHIERILSGFSDVSIEEEPAQDITVPNSVESDPSSTFRTAEEHVVYYEDSLKTNEFARALYSSPESGTAKALPPNASNHIVQITEEYVHTDDEAGLVFYEKKFLAGPISEEASASKQHRNPSLSSQSTAITLPPLDYDTDALRAELTNFGEPPGPITKHTKKLYLKKLVKYKRDPERAFAQVKNKHQPNYSVELLSTLRSVDVFQQISDHQSLETEMSNEFQTTSEKTWREGHLKKSFIYLLIDPRVSENLPAQQKMTSPHQLWKRFLQSIFYVGKGKSSRPYCHLYDAMKLYHQKSTEPVGLKPPIVDTQLEVEEEQIIFQSEDRIERFCQASKILNRKQMSDSAKLNRIIDIWRSQRGVICLHVFHSIMPAEAYTREAAIIDAIGVQNLTNLKRGDYYGKALSWPMKRRKQLGILLLHKAMLVFLAEGETQLLPSDLI